MKQKYLKLLAKEYPNIDSAASEMVNLSAIRSLPKGTEYFFSDLHGEYESFLHMLKSASGMIKIKIDIVFGKTVSKAERENLANLIYYPEKETIEKLKRLRDEDVVVDYECIINKDSEKECHAMAKTKSIYLQKELWSVMKN